MKRKLFFSLVFTFLLGIANTFAQSNCQGQFKTFSIGGWGTICNGENPGCYRDANFEAAFPAGLTIGCGSNTLTLTSSQAVEEFLPSGGPSVALSGTNINPAGSINNTLAGQLVAVSLSVGFDSYDADFSASDTSFGSLVILEGAHAGMTVADFLAYANQVIGGCASGNLLDLNVTASAINENYDNGTIDNGYLDCNTFRLYTIEVTSNVNCYGYLNGEVTVTVIGGLAPYTFQLSNGASSGPIAGNVYVFTGLAAGNYTVTAIDANGIVASGAAQFTVTQPTAIQASVSSTAVSCFGGNNGTVTIDSANISGGVGPYTFVWFNGSTSATISGLSSGSYTVSVTDSLGCTVDFSIFVAQPTLLGYTSSLTNVSCYAGSNGSATITPTGGTSPYTILWNNGSTSFTRNGLSANVIYTAVITDANGCTTNVSVSVLQPTVLSVGTVTTQAICYGGNGTATATAAGGTAPYAYSWNTNPAQTTATANLPVGTWTVTVTDANGCTVASNVTITLLSCEGFTTVTQGGYGAKCAGNNWGCYVKNNFAARFPSGLTVGSNGRFLKFTTAAAIEAFLPSGTTPRALNVGTLTNTTSYSNILAGQTVALTLSLGFDANPTFSTSSTPLGSLIVSSGTFAGKSVNELLAIANTVLGGGSSAYSAAQINDAIDAVNRNYDNGTVNLGYLACPCTASSKLVSNDGNSFDVKAQVSIYPNPIKANSTLEFTLTYDSKVSVSIYNMNGQLVNEVYQGNVSGEVKNTININATSMKLGVYILKLTTDRESITKSLLISE